MLTGKVRPAATGSPRTSRRYSYKFYIHYDTSVICRSQCGGPVSKLGQPPGATSWITGFPKRATSIIGTRFTAVPQAAVLSTVSPAS